MSTDEITKFEDATHAVVDRLDRRAEQAARESYSGKGLTETQFQQGYAITQILSAEIARTGSFREALTDYAHAFSRSERFDALRGETILRDLYKGRFGESLNETREAYLAREKALPRDAEARALAAAERIGKQIESGPDQPFYKAYDRAAVELADSLRITQSAAKTLMKDSFAAKHQADLYAHGKELEAQHQTRAERADPGSARTQTRSR